MGRVRGLIVGLTLLTAALVAAALFARPSTAGQGRSLAKTSRLGWTIPIRVKGRLAMRVTLNSLRASSSRWSARASVVNVSGHSLRPVMTGKTGWGWDAVTSGERAHPIQCNWSMCRTAEAAAFRPALPHRLRPGARWSGVFSGAGHLPRHWWLSFDLGYYYGWPRGGFGFGPTKQALHIP